MKSYQAVLAFAPGNKLNRWKRGFAVFLLCAASPIAAPAQTFTTLANFDWTNGELPTAPLVQGFDGNFYGTTGAGGTSREGTVFKITPQGTLTTLHSFEGTDGDVPFAGLVQGTDGNFYGTTNYGVSNKCLNRCGTVFKITPEGTLTTLHSFDYSDGGNPFAPLIQAKGGNFYGATITGGANGLGTVFKITSAGKLTTLHSFDVTDGYAPFGGLVQGTDGNLYGAASGGGTYGDGTVFKVTPEGTLTTLYSFCGQANCTDGNAPVAGLIQGTDGNFYGTTELGGTYDNGNCTSGCGTVFKVTPGGALTTLHSFAYADGKSPYGTLVQATDGNFYGTALGGGTHHSGTIFKVTAGGTFATLHDFDLTYGADPWGGPIQATDGNLYGTTWAGGAYGAGTVYSFTVK